MANALVRSKRDRIQRLRERVKQLDDGRNSPVLAVLKGILDLLEDEL